MSVMMSWVLWIQRNLSLSPVSAIFFKCKATPVLYLAAALPKLFSLGFFLSDGAVRISLCYVINFCYLIVTGWVTDLITVRSIYVLSRLMQIFIVPCLVPVILDLLILVLGWISGFVVLCLLDVIHKGSVDRCLFRWEIKLCRVRPIFFVPADEDEYQDDTFGIFQMVTLKKFLLLSCESSFNDSSSPVKAGVFVVLVRLRFDGPTKIWSFDSG